ncbi:MAG: oligopeptide/dipeptide ABC transporter ATP-binding protein, partial [Anaerolineales bacterium]
MNRLLEVLGLEVVYHTQKGRLKALHDVSFDVRPGEIVGIVGESGCGKSTVASTLLRLLPPNGEITDGQITFDQRDIVRLSPEELREMRGREIAMIFQDPMTSLNPVFDIETQMMDVERAHLERALATPELRRKLLDALTRVGIPDVAERIRHFPHQFSGGMRQRIMIAMALMSKPALLIADEPTSALDVTLEAQILELIKQLRQANDTAILFITHDLGVVAQLCDRVIVMYAGRVVEQGDVISIFEKPQHPYTQALLASVPSRRNYAERLATIPGRVPSLSALPPGCKFADRCPYVQAVCHESEPRFVENGSHGVRCHIYDPQSGYPAHAATVSVAIGQPASGAAPAARTDYDSSAALVTLKEVSTYFYDHLNIIEQVMVRQRGAVRAVDGVSLEVKRGEVVGLVGESGSGKTTLGKTILRLAPLTGGQISFDGQDHSRAGDEA